MHQSRFRVHVCFGIHCTARGSQDVYAAVNQRLIKTGRTAEIELIATSCRDRCDFGPSVNVYPGPIFYCGVTEDDLLAIIDSHLEHNRPVQAKVCAGNSGRIPGSR